MRGQAAQLGKQAAQHFGLCLAGAQHRQFQPIRPCQLCFKQSAKIGWIAAWGRGAERARDIGDEFRKAGGVLLVH